MHSCYNDPLQVSFIVFVSYRYGVCLAFCSSNVKSTETAQMRKYLNVFINIDANHAIYRVIFCSLQLHQDYKDPPFFLFWNA